jgi:hypothetical protein
MGALTAFICFILGEDDEDELVMFAALWPLVISLLIMIAPFALFYWIIDKMKQEIKR